MTKLQLMTLINTLINDNNAKEISAKDVRDVLEAVYDSAYAEEVGGRAYNGGDIYSIGDIIAYQSLVYVCRVAHTASVWAVDKNNWSDTISDAGTY